MSETPVNAGAAASTEALARESESQGPAAQMDAGKSQSEPTSRSSVSSFFGLNMSAANTPTGVDMAGIQDKTTGAYVRNQIAQFYVPHATVIASKDAENIAKAKGFSSFCSMLKPFGDRIVDRYKYRDSSGMTQTLSEFGVRFTTLGQIGGRPPSDSGSAGIESLIDVSSTFASTPEGDLRLIEHALESLLASYEKEMSGAQQSAEASQTGSTGSTDSENLPEAQQPPPNATSFAYDYFFRKIMSSLPFAAHETFAHPLASLIVVSSHNAAPLDAIQALYKVGNQARLASCVDQGYLRYYVYLHDDDCHDLQTSAAVFETLRRSFGTNCAFVRIRSSMIYKPDNEGADSEHEYVPVVSMFTSATEDIKHMSVYQEPLEGSRERKLYRRDYDELAQMVRGFIANSLYPFMERCMYTLNEQVAAPRRGLTSRFFSASRRLMSGGSQPTYGSSGFENYDPGTSSYHADTPEAQLRKLADIAFIMRDYKLAQKTYELLKKDSSNDKAWMYYAGAHEMAALATVMQPQYLTTKIRLSIVEPYLDTAIYTYASRCSASYATVRCITTITQVLQTHNNASKDMGADWLIKVLENIGVGRDSYASILEHVAENYYHRASTPVSPLGARRRKAALWRVIAAQHWLRCGKRAMARNSLRVAEEVYAVSEDWEYILDRLARIEKSVSFSAGERAATRSRSSSLMQEHHMGVGRTRSSSNAPKPQVLDTAHMVDLLPVQEPEPTKTDADDGSAAATPKELTAGTPKDDTVGDPLGAVDHL